MHAATVVSSVISARLVVFQGKQRCWAVGVPARRARCAGGRAKLGTMRRGRADIAFMPSMLTRRVRIQDTWTMHRCTRACIRVQCQNCILVSTKRESRSWHRRSTARGRLRRARWSRDGCSLSLSRHARRSSLRAGTLTQARSLSLASAPGGCIVPHRTLPDA